MEDLIEAVDCLDLMENSRTLYPTTAEYISFKSSTWGHHDRPCWGSLSKSHMPKIEITEHIVVMIQLR